MINYSKIKVKILFEPTDNSIILKLERNTFETKQIIPLAYNLKTIL